MSSRATLCRRCRSSASLRDRRSCSLLGASNLQTSPEDVRAMMRCKQHSSRCKQGKIYAYIHARTDLLRCKQRRDARPRYMRICMNVLYMHARERDGGMSCDCSWRCQSMFGERAESQEPVIALAFLARRRILARRGTRREKSRYRTRRQSDGAKQIPHGGVSPFHSFYVVQICRLLNYPSILGF